MEFRLLGSLEVVRDGRAVPVPGRKERALLSLLLLEANGVVPAETLIDRLWGERPPRTAANALQVYVGRLRKLLGHDVLVFDRSGYGLRVEADELDAARFEQLARTGAEALAADLPARAAKLLRGALEEWRGPPLPEFRYEDWAQTELARLEELRQTVFEDAVEADLRCGRHANVVAELEAAAAESPLRERLHGQLVLALYRCGRQAEALEAYASLRAHLRDELGLDPSPELQALQAAVLNHDPGLAAPPEAPRARPLPEPPTQLLGRDAELAAGLRLLRDERVRLLTLTGPGGIGKTRLGLELARMLAPEFGGGATLVSLASIADPALVPAAIVQALELKETRPSPEEVLADELQRAELLLLADNFEQVAAAAPVLTRLLEAAPGVAILVTSRAPLRVAGEHELPVPPLASPAAVELFVDRARAANPDFPETEARADVEKLCDHLDGLPLAIELAAARTRLLSPRALVERLGKRLDLLGTGRRDAPDRQQTLRTTIDWSYDLLGAEEQRLFARLGVFAGGWTLEAAESISAEAGAAVLDGLSALANESLILRSPGSDARFSMLEIVREYAVERLSASGEAPELRRRHAHYFLELARLAEAELHGPGQGTWLERIELELDNLRAADAYWRESGDGESRLRAAVALRRFWQLHGHLAEGLRMLEGALGDTPAADPPLRAKALNSAGLLAAEQGDFESARVSFEHALELARELGHQPQIAPTLSNLGNLAFFEGDRARASRLYRESLETALALGDLRLQAVACENLGVLELDEDRPREAVGLLQEAVANGRGSGDEHQLASSLRVLAAALLELRDLEGAAGHLAESLELALRIGDLITVAQGLETAAGIAGAQGEAERAAQLFGAADAAREESGVIRGPDEQSLYERWLGTTLSVLETAVYARCYDEGRALSLEQACALALGRPLVSV